MNNKNFSLYCIHLVATSLVLTCGAADAQIIPDGTMDNNSKVTLDSNTTIITGGTTAEGNLFHSFEQFSIPTGGAAYFNNTQSIQNIISRVTGSSISNIDGLIKANGTANLFLLNPNGIIFGSNASLNIGGSFLGSTASSIDFADGAQFSAKQPQPTALLTVKIPTGLNFTGNPGVINVQGTGHTQFIIGSQVAASIELSGPGESQNGLRLQPGKTLALVGGDVSFEGGVVTAPSGQIEIGSVDSGIAELRPTLSGWNLSYGGTNNFKNVRFTKQSLVDASGILFGDIHIQGRNITFTDGSLALIANFGTHNAGVIRIDALENLDMTGITPFNKQPLFGIQRINRGIVTATESGKGADVILSAKKLVGRDSELITLLTFGSGSSGNLTINSTESVEILGTSINESSGVGSTFGTITYGSGQAGDVNLSTGKLLIEDGGSLVSSTFGDGKGGNVTVNAFDSLKISGGYAVGILLGPGQKPIPAFSPSSIFAQSISPGDAGTINIQTRQLTIENGGRVAASGLKTGNSGDITINASDSINVNGSSSVNPSLNPSTIASSVSAVDPFLNYLYNIKQPPDALSGNVTIYTERLNLKDGAQITVRNDSTQNAGTLVVNADSVRLDNKAGITASTQSGQGGNIKINSDNLLLMRRNSQISTSAGNEQARGDGGQINIDTRFLVAPPLENSDITANAFSGNGGNVSISASAIFGFVPRSREELQTLLRTDNPNELDPSRLSSNDVTAISQTNPSLSGQVTFNTLDIGPRQALTNLPEQVVDVSALVAQGCSGSRNNVGKRTGEFIITGRGGLPPQPGEPVETQARVVDNDTLEAVKGQRSALENTTVITPSSRSKLVEAQGWVFDEQGEMILTAQPPNATPDNSSFTQANCYAP